MTVTASDLYALGLAVGSLLRGHVDPARQDRVLDLIRALERQAAGEVEPPERPWRRWRDHVQVSREGTPCWCGVRHEYE